MKPLLFLLVAIFIWSDTYGQSEYFWDSSAHLSENGVYCKIQKTLAADDVPVSCNRSISKKILDSLISLKSPNQKYTTQRAIR